MFNYELDFKEYRSRTGFVSISELKLFSDSPYSYFQKYIEKKQPEQYKPSRAQDFGTLCHCLLLEPNDFGKLYYISDVRKDERTKAYQEVKAEAGEKKIVSPAEFERASRCVAATLSQMEERQIDIKLLKKEVSVFVEKTRRNPLSLKARFDAYDSEQEIIFDYKTTEALPTHSEMEKHILNFKYHWQAAFYWDIHKIAVGRQPKSFTWIFQQTDFPYACAIYDSDKEMIDIGRLEYREKLEELSCSMREDFFPVMRPQKKVISLPRFYVSRYLTQCDARDIKEGEKQNGT